MERELHFHRTAETKFLDNITIRSTESAPFYPLLPHSNSKVPDDTSGIHWHRALRMHQMSLPCHPDRGCQVWHVNRETLVNVSHFNEGHDGTCRIVGRFVLKCRTEKPQGCTGSSRRFHLERSSWQVISPCTSPIRIDSNQIGRINTCTWYRR